MVGISFKKKSLHFIHLETYTSYKEYQETHKLRVPLDSFICYSIQKFCNSKFVAIRFIPIRTTPENEKAAFTIVEEEGETFTFLINEYEIPWTVALCAYPVLMADDVKITGLCAVSRQICFFRNFHALRQEHDDGLLGFRHTCLQAPNEVSVWTKFCEIEIIRTVQELLTNKDIKKVPNALVRFEDHMGQPVRIHNVYKVAQNLKKESVRAELEAASAALQTYAEQQANNDQEVNAQKQTTVEQQENVEQAEQQPANAENQVNNVRKQNNKQKQNNEKHGNTKLKTNVEQKANADQAEQNAKSKHQKNAVPEINAQKQSTVEENPKQQSNVEPKTNVEQTAHQTNVDQQTDNVEQQENDNQQTNVEQQVNVKQQTNVDQQTNVKPCCSNVELEANAEQTAHETNVDQQTDNVEQQENDNQQTNVEQQVNAKQQTNVDQQTNVKPCCSNVELEANAEQTAHQTNVDQQTDNVEQQENDNQQTNVEQQVNAKQQTNVDQQTNIKPCSSNVELEANAEQQAADKQDDKESREGSSSSKRTPKTRKWKSHKKKDNGIDSSTKIEDLEVNHEFAEGPYLTLADLVLLPSYYVIIHTIGETRFESLLPLTYKWYKNLISIPRIEEIFMSLLSKFSLKQLSFDNMTMPTAEDVSLYKCDPKRNNPKKRLYTKDEDIEKALTSITEGMELPISDNEFQPSFRWKDIPEHANPYSGYLPTTRVQRKSEQLENLALAVLSMATDGDVIVDFCCGTGHLGILLAYLLPRCTIILLENKENSLGRAKERVKKMRLQNVYYYQCNLDFFIGEFDIGIGLHACGIATDLILDKCLKQNARFVLSPCCYGAIHSTCRLEYPRSKTFASVPFEEYLCIAHAADQTHKEHPLAIRGARCMAIIDSDRARLAEEYGYKVTLMRLKPITCTPKNNLLVGISTEK